jgi:hypothetical protein
MQRQKGPFCQIAQMGVLELSTTEFSVENFVENRQQLCCACILLWKTIAAVF